MVPASGNLSISDGEIHLWQAEIKTILPKADRSQLDQKEQAFLDGIKSGKARSEYLVSHWGTRQILARYLSTQPNQVQFAVSDAGKPSLISQSQITFNRSHSGGWWVLAVALDLEIGVDIEETIKKRQFQGIVDRWFTDDEQTHFRQLPEKGKLPFFHSTWTQKEAVLKAAGVGLSRLSDYPSLAGSYGVTPFSPVSNVTGCVAYRLGSTRKSPKITYFPFSA